MTRRVLIMCCLIGVAIAWTAQALAVPTLLHPSSKPSIRLHQKGNMWNVQQLQGKTWRQIKGLDDIRVAGIARGTDEKPATAYFFNKNGQMVGQVQSNSIQWDGGIAKSRPNSVWVQQGSRKNLVESLAISLLDQPSAGPMEPPSSNPPTELANGTSIKTETIEQTPARSPDEPSGGKMSKDMAKSAAALEMLCIVVSSKSEKNRTATRKALEAPCDAPKDLSRVAWNKIIESLSTKKRELPIK